MALNSRSKQPPVTPDRLARGRESILALLRETGRPMTSGEIHYYCRGPFLPRASHDAVLAGLVADGRIVETTAPYSNSAAVRMSGWQAVLRLPAYRLPERTD